MRSLAALLVAAAGLVLLVSVGTPDARDLGKRLDSDSAAERDAATRELAELGEEARATLETLVRDGTPEARRRATTLLADLDDGSVARIRGLEARALVQLALRAPGRLAEGSPLDERLAELDQNAADVLAERAAARVELGYLDGELAQALGRHPSPAGVAVLARALRRGRVVGSEVVRASRHLEHSSAELLTMHARDDLDIVLARAGDPTRRAATALLLACEPSGAAELARDADPRVRLEVAHVLGGQGLAGAAALEVLAADRDPGVREAALDALARVPGAPRPGPAEAAARSEIPALRAAAARLLARDAVPSSLPVLAALASDDSARVRAAAERALAAIERSSE